LTAKKNRGLSAGFHYPDDVNNNNLRFNFASTTPARDTIRRACATSYEGGATRGYLIAIYHDERHGCRLILIIIIHQEEKKTNESSPKRELLEQVRSVLFKFCCVFFDPELNLGRGGAGRHYRPIQEDLSYIPQPATPLGRPDGGAEEEKKGKKRKKSAVVLSGPRRHYPDRA